MTLIPGGAFPDCEKLETRDHKRDDGKDATAFKSRANALVAMRSAVIDHEARLAALEAQAAVRPFP